MTPPDVERRNARDRWIALYVCILSVALALNVLGGDNAAKARSSAAIAAANTWAWFQAKNVRRSLLQMQVDEIEMRLAGNTDLDEETAAALRMRLADYRQQIAHLTSNPVSGEGLDELFVKAKVFETDRDRAQRQDPCFDSGQALLQIAIVLASVAIIAGGSMALTASGILGLVGTLLTLQGFCIGVSAACALAGVI